MHANANTALIQAFTMNRARSGWKKEEEELLWKEVRNARQEGRALKSVFDNVARETGRRPNSIRNYYYAKAKENPEEAGRSPAFVPFTEQEIWDLLITVLGEQAKGVSVRACTLMMGDGDTRAMLRYQNKYRSLIKTNPALIKEVIRYMRENDMPCYDPYEQTNIRKAGRPRKSEGALDGERLIQSVANLVHMADELEEAKKRIDELEMMLEQMEADRYLQSTLE